ncbi:MAG: ribosome-associated translation inhibitor RaiA [Clostridia bacterium]
MKIDIKERNYDVGKRLESLIIKKLSKFDRYFSDDASCKVMCKQDGKKFAMDINISSKFMEYRSEVIADSMFECLDLALPKIEKQIIRGNEKRKEMKKQTETDFDELVYLKEKPEYEDKNIVKKKVFDLDSITVEDAEVMLETTQHDFYVFLNAETGKVNLVYTRKDGQHGLIELKY